MKLSKRLQAIANYVNGFHSLADIACDHGYLGIYCALNYELDEVLLTDINNMPLESAMRNCQLYQVDQIVKTALGDGLAPLKKCYDVISISGIGANLMVNILKQDLEKAKSAKRLILSANNDVKLLREFLMNNRFEIIAEEMVYEYKYYEIIVCKPTDEKLNYTDLEIKYGPYLIKEKSANYQNYYHNLLSLLVQQAENVCNEEAKIKLLERIKEIESII